MLCGRVAVCRRAQAGQQGARAVSYGRWTATALLAGTGGVEIPPAQRGRTGLSAEIPHYSGRNRKLPAPWLINVPGKFGLLSYSGISHAYTCLTCRPGRSVLCPPRGSMSGWCPALCRPRRGICAAPAGLSARRPQMTRALGRTPIPAMFPDPALRCPHPRRAGHRCRTGTAARTRAAGRPSGRTSRSELCRAVAGLDRAILPRRPASPR